MAIGSLSFPVFLSLSKPSLVPSVLPFFCFLSLFSVKTLCPENCSASYTHTVCPLPWAPVTTRLSMSWVFHLGGSIASLEFVLSELEVGVNTNVLFFHWRNPGGLQDSYLPRTLTCSEGRRETGKAQKNQVAYWEVKVMMKQGLRQSLDRDAKRLRRGDQVSIVGTRLAGIGTLSFYACVCLLSSSSPSPFFPFFAFFYAF